MILLKLFPPKKKAGETYVAYARRIGIEYTLDNWIIQRIRKNGGFHG